MRCNGNTIVALIHGHDDVIQRPHDVYEALVVVTDVDSSSEEEEVYGVDWDLYANVPRTVSWAYTENHESKCQRCDENKYTKAKGERKKLVPLVWCNVCNFVWHKSSCGTGSCTTGTVNCERYATEPNCTVPNTVGFWDFTVLCTVYISLRCNVCSLHCIL